MKLEKGFGTIVGCCSWRDMGVVACATERKLLSASELGRKAKQQDLYRGGAKSRWLEADPGGKGYLHKFFS